VSGRSSGRVVVRRLVSGGQTGVDRAALDAAMALGIPCGGWCPRGRRSEGGPIPDRYPLQETPTSAYPERTERNVRDADGTLVLTRGAPKGGTALTVSLARRADKPVRVLDLDGRPLPSEVVEWIEREGIRTLNVAGPRESEAPGIHDQAVSFLREALSPRQ
jgi:hypothetical protein